MINNQFLTVITSLIVLLMPLWHSCTNNVHFLCSSQYVLMISFCIIIHGNPSTFTIMVEIILLGQPLLVAMSKFFLSPSSDLMKQIRVLYSPNITIMPAVLKVELRSIQSGSKDCGLFAIAYAVEIAYGNDPAKFIFRQSDMRQHLRNCLTSKSMSYFCTRTTHRFSVQRYHL